MSAKEADSRADEINSENSKIKNNTRLRPYKCETCGNYHLTSMTKHAYKLKNDIKYRNDVKEKKFIETESEHWNNYFGIDNSL